MTERRKTVRNRTYLGGVIAFNDQASTMDCLIRNLSPEGARLSFDEVRIMPDLFELTITRRDRAYQARIAWRGPSEAGVVFETNDNPPVPLDWARRLRSSEAEKTALRQRIAQLSESY